MDMKRSGCTKLDEGMVTFKIIKVGEEELEHPIVKPFYGKIVECSKIEIYVVRMVAVIKGTEYTLASWTIQHETECRIRDEDKIKEVIRSI